MSEPQDIVHGNQILFSEAELRCKGSGMLLLAPRFEEKLKDLRLAWNRPMALTSACRSTAHNKAEGGKPNSYHICDSGRGCCAVDVRIREAPERAQFIALALNAGWSVGVHRSFIHIDRRSDYEPFSKQILFLY